MESMGKKKPRRLRRSFTPEFKAGIVGLCRRGDRSVGQVAKDFELTETAVRDDQAGAAVAAIRNDRGLADGLLRAGQLPRLAVVAVTRRWPSHRYDWSLRGVLEDLYGDPMRIWQRWASDVRGHGIDFGHHVAEEAPGSPAAALGAFFAG